MNTPAVYFSWIEVPNYLVLESQLAKFDLPRTVNGPVHALIRTYNAYGKKDEFALYDMRESAPSGGTAATLEAAAARRTRVYLCDDCGAHTEAELGLHHPCGRTTMGHPSPCPWTGRRCAMCRRVAQLAAAVRTATAARADVTAWAAQMMRDRAVVVRVTAVSPSPATTAGGRRRPVTGWLVDAVDVHGTTIPVPAIARASRKTPGLGPAPVDTVAGAARLHTALDGRTVIAYTDTERELLATLLAAQQPADPDARPRFATDLRTQLTAWRGLIDPDTGRFILPLDPGPADRCALLIRRMTDTAPTAKEQG
ncbi:hypothetical protein GCM10009839_40080 [Catenulispora yoronensis]|uniref:Uncharacterized protein n=1 Tax=Catenulispora yoronensis TaxID=450799 RepID=A0ABP5FWA8_9ACTN